MLLTSCHAAYGSRTYPSWLRTPRQALMDILALTGSCTSSPDGCSWIYAVQYQCAAPKAGNTGIACKCSASGTVCPIPVPHYYKLLFPTAPGLPDRWAIYLEVLQSGDSPDTPGLPVPGILLWLYKASSLISSSTCCCISRMIGDISGSLAGCAAFSSCPAFRPVNASFLRISSFSFFRLARIFLIRSAFDAALSAPDFCPAESTIDSICFPRLIFASSSFALSPLFRSFSFSCSYQTSSSCFPTYFVSHPTSSHRTASVPVG